MKTRNGTLALIALVSVALSACAGGSGSGSAVMPALGNATSTATAAGAGTARSAALAAVAQCVRQHGIPAFQDPVLTQSGHVFIDTRSIQDATQSAVQAAQAACATELHRAAITLTVDPASEPPAPPQLVQAGVLAAQCARANGLPNMADPNSRTPYVPGHGFQLTASEIPAGGKQSPGFQHARHVCGSQFDAEIRASTLASLAGDG